MRCFYYAEIISICILNFRTIVFKTVTNEDSADHQHFIITFQQSKWENGEQG